MMTREGIARLPYEAQERIAIIMESCGCDEAEAVAKMKRQHAQGATAPATDGNPHPAPIDAAEIQGETGNG